MLCYVMLFILLNCFWKYFRKANIKHCLEEAHNSKLSCFRVSCHVKVIRLSELTASEWNSIQDQLSQCWKWYSVMESRLFKCPDGLAKDFLTNSTKLSWKQTNRRCYCLYEAQQLAKKSIKLSSFNFKPSWFYYVLLTLKNVWKIMKTRLCTCLRSSCWQINWPDHELHPAQTTFWRSASVSVFGGAMSAVVGTWLGLDITDDLFKLSETLVLLNCIEMKKQLWNYPINAWIIRQLFAQRRNVVERKL